MTDNPYAIPLEDLVRRAWVPVPEQVVEQPCPTPAPVDWSNGVPLGDVGGDVDGE